MKSVMSHSFSQVPRAHITRSSFDRSHGVKSTFDAGQLIPFFVDEALPGDTFNLRTAGFARMATPIYPIMDNMYMETFYFAVPIRLLWDNWERMMGEQDNPGDSTDFLVPQITAGENGWGEGTIGDYLGFPTQVPDLTTNALWLRAYNLIWNDWFRDQNLQDSLEVNRGDGPDPTNYYALKARGKRHDYFTSSLPWPQKGPAIDIPLGGAAPVVGDPNGLGSLFKTNTGVFDVATDLKTSGGGVTGPVNFDTNPQTIVPDLTTIESDMIADLSNATAATINQLRQAFQVQKMYERDARGGSRYTEIIRSHFGVTSPDARLQRPEYLGGGSSPININPITSTTDIQAVDPAGAPLGRLSATGTATFNGHGFSKSFTEHCILIGMVNVRADLTYQQGLNRMFSREDRLDFYWPALSHIGEQEVLNKEIYAQGTADDDLIFGYQERYAEYRYKPSTIHGAFRSNAAAPLDAWHLSQDFADLPTLSDEFIQDDPPVDRVVATPEEPNFIADFYHKLTCARPMPLFGVPGNIDRF
ncbi:major capsid protein [Microviridae sp.]|nr:major capsid protein [Microviridae sp.]